jgi:hypothetical protein
LAGPLGPAVPNFLAIDRDRWRRRNADPNPVPVHREDGHPDGPVDHHFLTKPS